MAHSLTPIARAISKAIWDTTPIVSSLIEGMDDTKVTAGIPRPEKGVQYVDPVYNTEVYRITDHVNDIDVLSMPSPQVMPLWLRNTYSRIQPFSVNDKWLLFYAKDGFVHLYDAATYAWQRRITLGGGACEPQWHPTDPDILYKFPQNGGLTISTHHVLTDAVEVVADFRTVASIDGDTNLTSILQVWPTAARCWTKEEGSPSADGRYWGLMVETADFQSLGLMTYDMDTNTIVGTYDLATDGGGIGRPDHCSMSPSGQWFIPSWHSPNDCSTVTGNQFYDPAGKGTLTAPCGLMAFSLDFTVAVPLNEIGPHSDLVLDANGDDWIVYVDYQQHSVPNDDGWVRATKVSTGETIDLWDQWITGSIDPAPAGGGIHFSGRAFNKPGWVLVSTYGSTFAWFEAKLIAIEIKANPAVYVLAHNHFTPTEDSYNTEAHGVVNRDFSRVVFNSSWGSNASDDLEVFEVRINPNDLVGNP